MFSKKEIETGEYSLENITCSIVLKYIASSYFLEYPINICPSDDEGVVRTYTTHYY